MHPFRFALHSSAAPTMARWRDRVRRAEELGYSAVYLTDHLDAQYGPLVAAAVAVEATSTLHVGTLVLNNDLRNPVVLAKEIATLGLAGEGRIEVGVGAGWWHDDYEATGVGYDDASIRVERLAESLSIMTTLWREGVVTFDGAHYSVREARCEPHPALAPRVIVGGGSKRVLSLAAEVADVVGVNTRLAAGVKEEDIAAKATDEHYDRCLRWVRDAAGERFELLELQVVAFAVMIVNSHRAAVRSATMLGFPGEVSLDLPVVLIGSEEELCERLLARRERWGFSNIVVPDEAIESFAPVVARLTGA